MVSIPKPHAKHSLTLIATPTRRVHVDLRDHIAPLALLDCCRPLQYSRPSYRSSLREDVGSFSADIPHQESSPVENLTSFTNHPPNAFVRAFFEGQEWTLKHLLTGSLWRVSEFWKNKVNSHRAMLKNYVDSLITKAIATKKGRPDRI